MANPKKHMVHHTWVLAFYSIIGHDGEITELDSVERNPDGSVEFVSNSASSYILSDFIPVNFTNCGECGENKDNCKCVGLCNLCDNKFCTCFRIDTCSESIENTRAKINIELGSTATTKDGQTIAINNPSDLVLSVRVIPQTDDCFFTSLFNFLFR